MVNELCKCDPVEGVSLHGDDLSDEKINYGSMNQNTLIGNKSTAN